MGCHFTMWWLKTTILCALIWKDYHQENARTERINIFLFLPNESSMFYFYSSMSVPPHTSYTHITHILRCKLAVFLGQGFGVCLQKEAYVELYTLLQCLNLTMDKLYVFNKKLKHKLNVCIYPNTLMSIYEHSFHGKSENSRKAVGSESGIAGKEAFLL